MSHQIPLESDRFYHVYNRGNNKENIFTEEDNYRYFKNLLNRHILPVADIYSYCFLKNHFHLVIKTKDVEHDISQKFSNLFKAYTKAFNKRNNRTGSLFQKNFKRKLIDDELYLKRVILYVNQNPHKHGFGDFTSYHFSSFKDLIENRSSFISSDEVYTIFSTKKDLLENLLNEFVNLEE